VGDEELLHRLFHEEDVRYFDPVPVSFRCACSRERTGSLLRALGRAEVEEIIAQDGEVTVTCEFCNRAWRFDSVDAGGLFAPAAHEGPRLLH
jgi:molecular chaperone Hsp33